MMASIACWKSTFKVYELELQLSLSRELSGLTGHRGARRA